LVGEHLWYSQRSAEIQDAPDNMKRGDASGAFTKDTSPAILSDHYSFFRKYSLGASHSGHLAGLHLQLASSPRFHHFPTAIVAPALCKVALTYTKNASLL
jgi:hypothetical protein